MTDLAPYDDPFSRALVVLWELLEATPEFTARVKPSNRIKFHEHPPRKPNLTHADTPAVRIVAEALNPHLFRTSNSSSFERTFTCEVFTSDLRVTAAAFPVEWAIVRAIAGAGDKLTALPEVKQVRLGSTEPPGADPEGRSDGWHTVIGVNISFWFRTDQIVPAAG